MLIDLSAQGAGNLCSVAATGQMLGTKPKSVLGEKETFQMINLILNEHVDANATLLRCAQVSLSSLSATQKARGFACDVVLF